MNAETNKRIIAYREALPHMRERVAAALLMLVIAVAVAATATYAWVTLSFAPEVSGMATSLAANGSLEIALAREDGSAPDEFDVDESVTASSAVTATNLQWGNLVNLADESYGLSNLTLRPAQINAATLSTRPLSGAVYGEDGRIQTMNSDYVYTAYNGSAFIASEKYGVRAISSFIREELDTDVQELNTKINAVSNAAVNVSAKYEDVVSNFSVMSNMINAYVGDKVAEYLGNATQTDLARYIADMIYLYEKLIIAMDAQKDAYVALANLQLYQNAKNSGLEFVETNWEELEKNSAKYDAANAANKNEVISISELAQFIRDYKALETDLSYLRKYNEKYKSEGTSYYWGSGGEGDYNINSMVYRLIQYPDMYIYIDGTKVTIAQIGTYATSLMGTSTRTVYIDYGILKRFEQNCVPENNRMNGRANCNIKYSVIINMTGNAYTTATGASTFEVNFGVVQGSSVDLSSIIAADTYGLVIDLWLRTNAEETCLTLEGAIAVNDESLMRYDGVNRIWGSTGEAVLTKNSTTQGGGSCYIYYADSPEDMERSLDLLGAMRIAFVDQTGTLLATAMMDTVNYCAANGRVTVPLVLDPQTKTTYQYMDTTGAEHTGLAVTTLYADRPVRISAIVYMDGSRLTNDDVLAASAIQGSLNIQFGSSKELETVGSNELIGDKRVVSATIEGNTFDFDNKTIKPITTVTVTVDGTQPKEMTGFFIRAVSSTQGSRETTMTFVQQESGRWIATHEFLAPGTYYLRHVRLDGVEYAIDNPEQTTKVVVNGYDLKSVSWSEADAATVRTSDNSYPITITAEFASNDFTKMPKKVEARLFRGDGVPVNIPLYNTGGSKWTGTGTLAVSGEYTLQYMAFDGRLVDLAQKRMVKTIDLALGLYVEVYNAPGQTTQEEYDTSVAYYAKEITAKIFDNAGNELRELKDAWLYYSSGSIIEAIGTPLAWNEENECYTGLLQIQRAGRFSFAAVRYGSGSITKCTASPTYVIISPNPPAFDGSSESAYYGKTQFAPLTNDAVLDGIKITNGDGAMISAVVYNDQAQTYYTIEPGEMKKAGDKGYYFRLPTYTKDLDKNGEPLPNATYTQEGKWQLVALALSECYDPSGNFHGADDPIIWAGNDALAQQYLAAVGLRADASYDFSKLSTTVSCTLKVQFNAGTTKIGNETTEFMYPQSVREATKMSLALTDGDGKAIPKDKVEYARLNIQFAPDDTATQKENYTVQSSAVQNHSIDLTDLNAEDGLRYADGSLKWQYAGNYTVRSLEVKIKGTNETQKLTYDMNSGVGVPEKYTLISAGPAAENIKLGSVVQGKTVFGKTGDDITGTFLQSYAPEVSATVSVESKYYKETPKIALDASLVKLTLTMKHTGGSKTNGYYTFTAGTTKYEKYPLIMTADENGVYRVTGEKILLAGTYSMELAATVNGETKTPQTLTSISVYSKKPTLTITGVSPAMDEQFKMNIYNGENKQYWSNATLIDVQNYYSETLANVYIKAENAPAKDKDGNSYSDYQVVDYTLPSITMTLGNLGSSFKTATATVPGSQQSFVFSPSNAPVSTAKAEIGVVGEASFKYSQAGCNGDVTILYETQTPVGEQRISTVTATDANDAEYTVDIANAVTIREKAVAPPSISYVAVSNYTTPAGQSSTDGDAFQVTLPSDIGTTEDKNFLKAVGGIDWTTTGDVEEKLTFYTLKSIIKDQDYSSSTCSPEPAKYTATFTYELYTRRTLTEEKTDTTQKWHVTYGVVGWNVGGTQYAPGETITVSSAVTATPVIGVVKEVLLDGSEIVTTLRRVTVTDTFVEERDVSKQAISNISNADAEATAKGYYKDCKPDGYEWFDPLNPTKDGHNPIPVVTTETLS